MAYEKQNWTTGETITQEKLNHMEDGIADVGTGLVCHAINDAQKERTTLDKTWKEIDSAFASGKTVVAIYEQDNQKKILAESYTDGGRYTLQFISAVGSDGYTSDSEDGYPSLPWQ